MTLHHVAARHLTRDEEVPRRPVDDTERETEVLFRRLQEPTLSDTERRRTRDRIVELNLPQAIRLTHRYRNRGQDAEDLRQVAAIGLLKAVDGFDPGRGKPFFGYLIPTVTGEVKRHFRDHGWDMHVPRRLQERYLVVTQARADLTQRLGHAPTAAELGAALDLDEREVLEALGAAAVYDVGSLNKRVSADDDAGERQEFVGAEDDALVSLCDRLALRDLVRDLPDRDRYILSQYFFAGATQERIAGALGMSQMNVSRLLRRTLDRLRLHLTDAADTPAEASYSAAGIAVTDTRQAIVVTVEGETDTALLGRALVDAAVRIGRGRVVVDLRSAGGAGPGMAKALVHAYRAAGAGGARIRVVNVPAGLYDLLCRLGVTRLVPCRPLTSPAAHPAACPAVQPARPATASVVQRHPWPGREPAAPETVEALTIPSARCLSRLPQCGRRARAVMAPRDVRARAP
ncbi:SigB/SigF/SigG family RNA polymerase sigma factor [Pseudosporangium ferrugineum]|uniref:RNA polymerase sigma-70 factor (Sigma-B/F/G subfamily) n=1 Tax=Pseudosporangium ferrugineum TaxID=439699 RepID=A0A2T0RG75_9ACTN|nr:SigB/SigF/SigG family RNA polymerase sigma factor [Pseudosporangium ferrugineum]PRY20168.1 RNA polymerase sigma-70 factor (sigma-B/F/G subfamily) [Pseudosporangium ferrugineum]